jgi:radical SAM/Cys-rich protein
MAIKQRAKSLVSRGSALSDMAYQLRVLDTPLFAGQEQIRFEEKLADDGAWPLRPTGIDIFQLNIGKKCNQTCAHCHVDAGPDRTEMMSREDLEQCVHLIREHLFPTVDITGGAPELHPDFRWFVEACREAGAKVIDRCNLTIIRANPRFHDLPDFFARHQVEVVSSMPHFTKLRLDAQRGEGVFEDSIEALRMLNAVGYGQKDSGLQLHLVYNPTGAFLPGSQAVLEEEFRRQLSRRYGIVFNQLYVITNLPIARFLDYLIESDNYEGYMQELIDAYNPATVSGLMCRNTISVGWDGRLYDCDFNQMLGLELGMHIRNFDRAALEQRDIMVNQHCYGCTAGSGSSCGGSIV